mmetsp:Transcript_23248/g.68749  ORF Transcript_23248/g.68749 Transcript_23248/m.68749 type:complete len:401 (+) Transcript_23248:4236-5438(+)
MRERTWFACRSYHRFFCVSNDCFYLLSPLNTGEKICNSLQCLMEPHTPVAVCLLLIFNITYHSGMVNVTGLCGRSCEGTPADSVGMYEIDSKTDVVVATHVMAEGAGGDPHPSPDGKYIVMLGKNAGKTIRILEAGASGAPSTLKVDLELNFNRTGFDGLSVWKDLAFVERDGRTLFVMPSGTEHKVAIVDMTDGADFKTTYVKFSEKIFDKGRAPHGRYRQLEWAVGTDYVWTNDSSEDEIYVIDVVQGRLVRTITDADTSRLVSIQNWQRVHEAEMMGDIFQEVRAQVRDEVLEEVRAMNENSRGGEDRAGHSSGDDPTSVSKLEDNTDSNKFEKTNTLAIVAIVAASLALIVGIANLIAMMAIKKNKGGEMTNVKSTSRKDADLLSLASVEAPPSVN